MKILFYDAHIVVCEKPVGVSSEEGGMPDLLREALGGQAYCVHRLDTAVGGVMVYARSKQAAARLSAAIAADGLEKEYLAAVEGILAPEQGEMTDYLLKDGAKGKSYVVKRLRKGVKEAKLSYRVLESCSRQGEACSLVRVRLHTGRFHQIRVQFASRKHPLLGDGKYGSRWKGCTTALWSCRLAFPHPKTGEPMEFESMPPKQFPWDLFGSGQ